MERERAGRDRVNGARGEECWGLLIPPSPYQVPFPPISSSCFPIRPLPSPPPLVSSLYLLFLVPFFPSAFFLSTSSLRFRFLVAAQELVPRPIRTPRVSGTPIISPITRFASMPRHPHGIPRRITREYYEFIRFYYGLQYDDTGMIAPIVDSLERMTQRAHI